MKITKLGHCCLIIETRGVRFLTDPGNYTVAQNTVTNIDCVIISHEHTDHLHIESLQIILKNNPEVQIVCNASVGNILDKTLSMADGKPIPYIKVAHGDTVNIKGVNISGHGTKHAPIYKDYEQVENTGYLFDAKLFYPGDAFFNPHIPIDILAFPVTAPWCTISEALNYVLEVRPRIAFPIHDGNLIRHGLTNRLPGLILPEAHIQFVSLELGKETEL
jgi:L-ascorbate metabolism protein UlaG (beta-lactamase superfamily)